MAASHRILFVMFSLLASVVIIVILNQFQMSGHRGWSEHLKIVHGQLAIAMISVPAEGAAELIDLLRIGNRDSYGNWKAP